MKQDQFEDKKVVIVCGVNLIRGKCLGISATHNTIICMVPNKWYIPIYRNNYTIIEDTVFVYLDITEKDDLKIFNDLFYELPQILKWKIRGNHPLHKILTYLMKKNLLSNYLSNKEIMIIMYRTGFSTGEIMTLKEVGEKMNRTKERIRQAEIKIYRKLEWLQSNLLKDTENKSEYRIIKRFKKEGEIVLFHIEYDCSCGTIIDIFCMLTNPTERYCPVCGNKIDLSRKGE